jgi:hypothetical protein
VEFFISGASSTLRIKVRMAKFNLNKLRDPYGNLETCYKVILNRVPSLLKKIEKEDHLELETPLDSS